MKRLTGIWSLWEMITNGGLLVSILEQIETHKSLLKTRPPLDRLDDLSVRALTAGFWGWRWMATHTGLPHTLAATEHVVPGDIDKPELLQHIVKTNADGLFRLQNLNEAFRRDMSERLVYVLPENGEDSYEKGFGQQIDTAFPSAVTEIKEANTCFALGRYTASVFHHMRAVEHAYRALAISLGVKKPITALEYDTWGQLLGQIEPKCDALLKSLQGPKQPLTDAREFFNQALADMRAFMDAVRNIVMHTRSGGTYDIGSATSIRIRVRECLERLAKHVSEGGPRITKSTFKR